MHAHLALQYSDTAVPPTTRGGAEAPSALMLPALPVCPMMD